MPNQTSTPDSAAAAANEPLPPTDNVLACIHVVSNLIDRAFYSEVESKWGITLPEWRVVLTLADRPGASAMEITDLWGMEKMAVSRAARRLERDGFVVRTIDRRDRRRYTLALTAAGRALYRKIEPDATARYREILGALSRTERATTLRSLRKMIEQIGRLPE